ncbi:phage scaffolding protein [Granulicatella elegans]|uniref:phage scaffolding protein n=1 Tax=Granulicatella elegans TaxID=137732 RepID=UPI001D139C3A|nr:phage scaffolding protein [Granulicatella elegans]UEA31372.1 phage scaffolding protein [Granulicatella elegans]
MNRKFLEKIGLSEEQIAQIMAEHGKSTQELQNMLSTAEGNATSLQKLLDERDNDLKVLKKETEGNAELLQKYNDLDKKYKTQKEEYELEMADMKLNYAISMQISSKVHDTSIVNGLLDKSKLFLDENGWTYRDTDGTPTNQWKEINGRGINLTRKATF